MHKKQTPFHQSLMRQPPQQGCVTSMEPCQWRASRQEPPGLHSSFASEISGRRNPDGQGFAAFGQIVEGMDVVRTIFAQAEDTTDQLSHPIPIDSVSRI
jgi:hypothetical protein